MKTRYFFLSFFITAVIAFSCSRSNKMIEINPEFAEHISGFTSGVVSKGSLITIQLTDPVEAGLRPDSSLLKNIFEFSPEIKGSAKWISDREIVFTPSEALKPGQLYTASFNLKKIKNVKKELRNFEFQFATQMQKMDVSTPVLYSYDDYNIEWQQLMVRVRLTDEVDTAALRKCFSLKQNGKNLPVRLDEWSSYYNEYNIIIDSISRTVKPGEVELEWNGKPIHALSKGKNAVAVSALGDFTVTTVEVGQEDDQTVEVSFSESLEPVQNLKGIVTIDGIDNLTYSISYNILSIYLPKRVEGEKTLRITSGIRNFKGYKKLSSYENTVLFEGPKPRLKLKGSGSILPNSQGLIFPFEASSLKSVDIRIVKIYEKNVHHFLQVNNLNESDELTRFGNIIAEKKIRLDYDKSMDLRQWNKHVIDLNSIITPERGAIYKVSLRFTQEDAICDCEAAETDDTEDDEDEDSWWYYDIEKPIQKKDTWTEKTWRTWGGFEGYGGWSSDYQDSPCDKKYYRGKSVSRNILASDIGIIYKVDEDHTGHAIISDLITTKPISGAQVEYFDYAKKSIVKGKTDANGFYSVKLPEKPFILVATVGEQKGYLKLRDGYSNSLSKFDVEGEVLQKGVKGYIYGERGVWRPGDSLYLTFILEDKEKALPVNHPVNFELQNPFGQVIYQKTSTQGINGMYSFNTKTSDEAPTGNYTAVVKVGNSVFTRRIKIETVKPNRLKIYLEEVPGKDSLRLSSKWLHGAPAKELDASVSVKISAIQTVFDAYRNYVFDSPARRYVSNESFVYEGKLDKEGTAMISGKRDVGNNAPGMLKTTYITKVFEKSGNFSIDRTTLTYSPFKTYVGLESPKTKTADNTYQTDMNYKFNVVTLDEKGKLKTKTKVRVKVYKIQWRWWYEKDEEDVEAYISRSGSIILKDSIMETSEGKTSFGFKVKYPDYGRYLITVTDTEGQHQTGEIITVDWPYWNRGNRKNNENATMLNFSSDKTSYNVGENIKLTFPSPGNGRALVSIENRTSVLKKFWVETVKGETTCEFQATAEMSPNVFIHVTLIQPHLNTMNDLPIRMYGIIPVTVDDPKTHIYPVITMADVLKPNTNASIKVKEKSGRKMTYTLAVVDEGLLDLTNYTTPKPWSAFYAKEALGVKTWDLYDQVIGAYAGKLDKLLSVGGDAEGLTGKSPKANRFKPMVRFIGPFVLEAGEERNHQVDIPNYVGSVRVMVVAGQDGAYGEAEKTVAVKKPLMLLATLPRVVGPGEKIALPVNIFAMESFVKDVKITVETNAFFQLEGNASQSIRFDQIGDEVVNFELKTIAQIGVGKVKITAVSGNEKAVEEIEIDVRPSNPVEYETLEMALEAGQDWNTTLRFNGLKGSNKVTVEVSNLPAINLEKRISELIRYPHGCIEQTTSTAFPQLYLSELTQLTEQQQDKASRNVKNTLSKLQLYQTMNGGFAYWQGENYENEWATNYVGHFILEAERKGYKIAPDLKKKWISYQKQKAVNWSVGNNEYVHSRADESYQLTQAYRLFTLALSGNAEIGAMNRLKEERGLKDIAKWRLASTYYLIGQKETALALIRNLSFNINDYRELSYTYGSGFRDKAMILETLSLLKQYNKADLLIKEVAKTLSSDQWLSTQETGYGLLAVNTYAGLNGTDRNLKYTYALNGKPEKEKISSRQIDQLTFTEKDFSSSAPFNMKNTSSSRVFVKIITEKIAKEDDQKSYQNNLQMKVTYKDLDGKEIQPGKLKQGKEFIAEVEVYNPGKNGIYKEMALSQIFASGWEIHNSRMDDGEENTPYRYMDVRDDRVYYYFDLGPDQKKTFSVHLNATYLGRFYLPGIYCEAMYDHSIRAKKAGQWVEVNKP